MKKNNDLHESISDALLQINSQVEYMFKENFDDEENKLMPLVAIWLLFWFLKYKKNQIKNNPQTFPKIRPDFAQISPSTPKAKKTKKKTLQKNREEYIL